MTILKHHIFAHAAPAWGHNKPLIALAVLITEARPDVVVTVVTNQAVYPKAIRELMNLSGERRVSIRQRIHIIDVVGQTDELMFFFPQVNAAFEGLFKRSGTIKCMSSGQVVVASNLPRPTLAIIDLPKMMYQSCLGSLAPPEA
ncbi:hypothetical protein VNI00_015770 [Paramarasmius palmivorus]|uniref:Uncharacterized protein n=1 Tax=Paramarasmius palmivorus TaxID=297713 RepID=A0AAW0BL17_9AGAR